MLDSWYEGAITDLFAFGILAPNSQIFVIEMIITDISCPIKSPSAHKGYS